MPKNTIDERLQRLEAIFETGLGMKKDHDTAKQALYQDLLKVLPEEIEWTVGEALKFSTDPQQSHFYQAGHNSAVKEMEAKLKQYFGKER